MQVQVIIPFRLREGADPRRQANLDIVHAWWYAHGFEPQIVSDGLVGDAQFNRHRAYNRAVEMFPETEVLVFTEADMLIHPSQILAAVKRADEKPGLVVPFTQYRYLSDEKTAAIRDVYHGDLDDYCGVDPEQYLADFWARPVDSKYSIFGCPAESVMDNGTSIGAVNVVSRKTLEITGGFTEATKGNWYDDRIIEEGFAFLTGQHTRYVEGPAVHMYHLPGHSGAHLSDADKAATAINKTLLKGMRRHINLGRTDLVRHLMDVRS